MTIFAIRSNVVHISAGQSLIHTLCQKVLFHTTLSHGWYLVPVQTTMNVIIPMMEKIELYNKMYTQENIF